MRTIDVHSVRVRWPMASPFRLVVILLISLAGAAGVTAQPDRSLRGRAVQSVIDELRAAGAPFVYSSNLLPSSLTVVTEPRAADPLALAREILAPHGLVVREENGVWLVVRGDPPAVAEPGGSAAPRAGRVRGHADRALDGAGRSAERPDDRRC